MESTESTFRFGTGSVGETEGVGELLGGLLVPGDVIGLVGELGAGKTAFVRGVARGAGVPTGHPVNSPTFTILNVYEGRECLLFHLDLYRLDDPSELEGIGMSELQSGRGMLLVEWADRYPDALPSDRLTITLRTSGQDMRDVLVTAGGPQSQELLDELRGAFESAA